MSMIPICTEAPKPHRLPTRSSPSELLRAARKLGLGYVQLPDGRIQLIDDLLEGLELLEANTGPLEINWSIGKASQYRVVVKSRPSGDGRWHGKPIVLLTQAGVEALDRSRFVSM